MLNWQPLYPVVIYLLAGLGVIALLIAAYQIAVTPKNRRWLLFAIRGAIFAALILLLLNPIDRRETVLPPQPPSVAMLSREAACLP